jgi:hypothetical protein
VGSLVLAITIGFVLGVLLMVLLVTGREEERLLEKLERVESSTRASAHGPEGEQEQAGRDRSEAPRVGV